MNEADPLLALPAMDVPVEGVPDYLEDSLRRWISDALDNATNTHYDRSDAKFFAEAIAVRLRVQPRVMGRGATSHEAALIHIEKERLFQVVNAILTFAPERDQIRGLVSNLQTLLRMGASAYEVNDFEGDPNGWQIVRRLDEAMKSALETAMDSSNQTTAGHLSAAWLAAFGLQPNADVAYAEAVKAVEAASIPLVVPSGAVNPTLGSVLTVLRGAAAGKNPKWELALPEKDGSPRSLEVVISMLETLWNGHRSRHSGSPTSRPNLQHEAEASVFLAITLVYWFSKGIVASR